MAINTLSNISSQEIRVPVVSAVNTGDLLAMTDGGLVSPVSSSLTLAQQNLTTAGASAVSAYSVKTPNSAYQLVNNDVNFNAIQLGNGVVAVGHLGDGVSSGITCRVSYFSQNFGAYQPSTTVSTLNPASIKLIKLSATKFVVGYVISSTGELYIRVINNDGTAASAEILVAALTNNNIWPMTFSLCRLSDSSFVVAYNKTTTLGSYFKRFNDTGTLIGSEVTIETGGADCYSILLHSTTGEFWIKWRRYTASAGVRFARYNSSGVLQGSVVTITSANSSTFNNNYTADVTELSNGNVLIIAPNSNGYPDLYTYTSAGVAATSNTTWHNSLNTIAASLCCPSVVPNNDGTFMLANMVNNNSIRISKFTNALNQIFTITTGTVFIANSGAGYGFLTLFLTGSAGYGIAIGGFNGTTYNSTIGSVDSSGTTIGSVITLYSGLPNLYGGIALRINEGIIFVFGSGNTSGVSGGSYNLGRKSIIGVSQVTSAANSVARVATVGTYTINNAPSNPGYFDNRTAVVPGPRGIIAGTTAILSGTT